MGKILIVSEKPSVGKTIANVVGATEKKNGYMEGENYVVSWAHGHLLTLEDADKYNSKFKQWSVSDLPIVPEIWKYKIIPDKESKDNSSFQLKVLRYLMNRADIDSLVEATDAGREGELIFRLIYYYSGCKKPFKRLWISSLEEGAIRDGMRALQPSQKYNNLYKAALARSRADWLFGINGTRLYSIINPIGQKGITSVGRVQTPTLKMIVDRQAEIDNFSKTKSWVVVKDFGSWKAETDKFETSENAEKCFADTTDKQSKVVNIEKKTVKVSPPLLYSLSTLQQDTNKKYGISADDTLKIIQELYEKKILTYPRTDSNYITTDMVDTVKCRIEKLIAFRGISLSFERKDVERCADDSKVSDHYAVICTDLFCRNPSYNEIDDVKKKVLDLVINRMITAVSGTNVSKETKVTCDCEGYNFTSNGKQTITPGWKEIDKLLFEKEEKPNGNEFPSDLAVDSVFSDNGTSIDQRETNPPKPFTEADLLAAMEKAGAKQMDKEVERKGLGTSATRAAMIELLLSRGFIERKLPSKKAKAPYLFPTEAGKKLVATVSEKYSNVDTTVEWENRLLDIEKGKADFQVFCDDITQAMTLIINEEKAGFEKKMSGVKELGSCPFCGETLKGNGDRGSLLTCPHCRKSIYRTYKAFPDLYFSDSDIADLLNGDEFVTVFHSERKNTDCDVTISLDEDKTEEEGRICFSMKFGYKN